MSSLFILRSKHVVACSLLTLCGLTAGCQVNPVTPTTAAPESDNFVYAAGENSDIFSYQVLDKNEKLRLFTQKNFTFAQDAVVNSLLSELVEPLTYLKKIGKEKNQKIGSLQYDKVVTNMIEAIETQTKLEKVAVTKLDAFQYDKLFKKMLEGVERTINENPDIYADYTQYAENGGLEAFLKSRVLTAQAKTLLGVPYVFGGESRKGFDCSGLVQYAMNNIGVDLPRTAHEQYLSSEPIKRDDLRAGDLVFFKINRSKRISHVGIYLGNNKFIHAPSRGKVVSIVGLDSKYYAKRFVRGGRVIGTT